MGFYNRYSLFAGYSNCGCRENDDCRYGHYDCDYDDKYDDFDCGGHGSKGGYGHGGYDDCDEKDYNDYGNFKREGRRERGRKERCGCVPWQGKCRDWEQGHGNKECREDRRPNKRRCCCPICNFFSMFCCK